MTAPLTEDVSIETLRAALDKMHRRACGDTSQVYMRIPADPKHDADLLLSAALDELEALRASRDEAARLRDVLRTSATNVRRTADEILTLPVMRGMLRRIADEADAALTPKTGETE